MSDVSQLFADRSQVHHLQKSQRHCRKNSTNLCGQQLIVKRQLPNCCLAGCGENIVCFEWKHRWILLFGAPNDFESHVTTQNFEEILLLAFEL